MSGSKSMVQNSPTRNTGDDPRLINLRFSLRRLLTKTALSDIYWSNDLHSASEASPEKNVLLVLINPALPHLANFETAWQQVLSRPAPAASAYPQVIDYGIDDGEYWLALDNIDGMLLSERINELDERGLPLETALDTLGNINHTLSSIQAGPYGYLEPGAIQQTDRGYIILNAPIVRVLQHLSNNNGTINKLALHSAYLSPSVAVGDAPVTEDDTFSTACLLYTLLSGNPPFQHSSLTSVTKGDRPTAIKKLKKESWEILDSALQFQRTARPENPEKLMGFLRRTNKRRIAFPLAVLAAAGVAAFAGYHLYSEIGNFLQPSEQRMVTPHQEPSPANDPTKLAGATKQENQQQVPQDTPQVETPSTQLTITQEQQVAPTTTNQQDTTSQQATNQETIKETIEEQQQNLPQTEVAKNTVEDQQVEDQQAAEQDKALPASQNQQIAEQDNPTADTPKETETNTVAENTPDKQEVITELLKQARTALNLGQLDNINEDQPGAISLLRQAAKLDEKNEGVQALLSKAIDHKFNAAEKEIGQEDLEKAEALLIDSDDLIREFMQTEKLQRQVRLESKISILREEQKQVSELLSKAKTAFERGDLTSADTASDNALNHLSNLLFKQPNHNEASSLLEGLVQKRQQATRQALAANDMERASTYLEETQRLIRKYRLNNLKTTQETLSQAYQAATKQTEKTQAADAAQGDSGIQVIDLTVDAEQQPNQAQAPAASTGTTITNTVPTATQTTEIQTENNVQQNQNANTAVPATQPQATTPVTTALPAGQPQATTPATTALTEDQLPVEKLTPNSIAIQELHLESQEQAQPLQPQQVFVPIPDNNTANFQANPVPIWEENNLNNLQQDGQLNQPVVIYDPIQTAPTTAANNQQPQRQNIQVQQPSVSYNPPPQPSPQTQLPNQAQQQQAGANFNLPQQPQPIPVPVETITELTPVIQPVLQGNQPQLPQADFNANNQAIAVLPDPNSAVIPELQEIPVSTIEEIFPVNGQ